MKPVELLVSALDDAGLEGTVSYNGKGMMYQCPAHDDDKASLSVAEGDDGRALVYCFAGCSVQDVVSALSLEVSDLFDTSDRIPVAEYVYEDESGEPLTKVVRYQPKGFQQMRWQDGAWVWGLEGARRVPYRLPELVRRHPDATVYVTEGEKDADTLAALGHVATTFLGGAGKWRDEYLEFFQDARVVLAADNDDAGREGARRISTHLRRVARGVEVVVPAFGKDVTDHVRAGLGVDALVPEGDGLDEFGPLDWSVYVADRGEWLLEPYVPRAGRVLAFGPAGSLKSLWAMWLAAHVAKSGGKVAYFSLEMQPSMTAQRLQRLDPPKENFLCFTKDFRLGAQSHTEKLVRGLKDFDLVVVDSWTAARAGQKDSNEQVSALDNDFFLPVIRETGAAVLVIDNSGHDAITDKGVIKTDHARGASAKHDKMDTVFMFRRPREDNNYLTRITCKKMRYDRPWPGTVEVYTPTDVIEFYDADSNKPMWPGLDIMPKPEATPYDEIAAARLRDKFSPIEERQEA